MFTGSIDSCTSNLGIAKHLWGAVCVKIHFLEFLILKVMFSSRGGV